MCLSIAIERPHDALATGSHAGFQWIVTNNGRGYRCGYVQIPPGHPWHGTGYDEITAKCHGGLTFSEPDVECGNGGADDAWWIGFDCAHSFDLGDPQLPGYSARLSYVGRDSVVRSQQYVEAECRSLCEQAKAAAEGKESTCTAP